MHRRPGRAHAVALGNWSEGTLASPELSGTEPVKDREKGGRSGRRRRAPGPRRGQ